MHIGLFSPAWPVSESANGIVTYVHHLRAELLSQGHRVSVFANVLGPGSRDAGIHRVEPTLRHRLEGKLPWLGGADSPPIFRWGRVIAAAIDAVSRADPLDVVEMEESFGWSAEVSRLIAAPVVVRLHGPAFLTLAEEAGQAALVRGRIESEGEALRQARALVSPSQSALRSTASRYQLDPAIAAVIPNPLADAAPLWELEHCERKTILFVGRFDRLKGGDTALIAFRRLLQIDGELKLVFAGPDAGLVSKDGSRVLFEEFCSSLFTPRQRRNIAYLGSLPAAEVAALRSRAMVTLVLSRWEAQGYTALEAMLHGCPLVVTDAGALRETVEHGVTGLVARLDDIDDLCANVMRVLHDPVAARTMAGNARRFVAERHAPRRIASQALELYGRVIAMARRSALELP
jgi:glycosyltransferase involved in cell wall biosynthesis